MSTAIATISDPDQRRITSALAAALAPNTLRAYTSAWRTYSTWITLSGYEGREFEPLIVTAYLTTLSARAPSTVETARAAILHHAGSEAQMLRSHAGLRLALKGVRRETRRSHATSQARALTGAEINAVVGSADSAATPSAIRDRALVLLMLALGLRASDAASLRLSDVRAHDLGLEVTVRHSKTSDLPVVLSLPRLADDAAALCPVRALNAWTALLTTLDADAASLPLFRAIRRGGFNIARLRLSAEAIGGVIMRSCERAGVDPTGVSSHSCRATFATRALEAGYAEREVQRVGRWASADMVRHYNRSESWEAPAAGWLGRI